MKNKEMLKLYKQILREIRTSKYHDKISLDKNFEFKSGNENCQEISIILTKKEKEDISNGIYNPKTSILKELDYIVSISNDYNISPLKSIEEKQIYLKAIKRIKKELVIKYFSNLFKDFISAFNIKKLVKAHDDLYTYSQLSTFFGGVTATLVMIAFECSILIIASGIIFTLCPTLCFILINFIKKRHISHVNNVENKKQLIQAMINSDYLFKNLELSSPKESKLLEVESKSSTKNIQDPVFNEIFKLIELLSTSNLSRQTIQNYLSKIKSIKEAYASRLSQINELSVDNEYTIQGCFIQEIAKLEYDIRSSIDQNKETIQNQTESNLIDAKIYSLEQRTKNR